MQTALSQQYPVFRAHMVNCPPKFCRISKNINNENICIRDLFLAHRQKISHSSFSPHDHAAFKHLKMHLDDAIYRCRADSVSNSNDCGREYRFTETVSRWCMRKYLECVSESRQYATQLILRAKAFVLASTWIAQFIHANEVMRVRKRDKKKASKSIHSSVHVHALIKNVELIITSISFL